MRLPSCENATETTQSVCLRNAPEDNFAGRRIPDPYYIVSRARGDELTIPRIATE